MDSRLKTALLQTAALKRETPGKIITRALAHYLKRRRAKSAQPKAPRA
jgi:predicted transcriptional regulator